MMVVFPYYVCCWFQVAKLMLHSGIHILCILLIPVYKVGVSSGEENLQSRNIVPHLHSTPFLQWYNVTGCFFFR